MKKDFLLPILGLLLISTVSIAQQRIIEQPSFENSNTTLFEINKLELSDSLTVLHCDFYNSTRPGAWVAISPTSYLKGKSGQIYKVLDSEGYILGEQAVMPQSGNLSFMLFAEPLSKEEDSFDFMEGEKQGHFRIKGIKTFKSKPPVTPIRCVLKGEVVNRPQSSRLILTKEGGDERVSAIYIPIRNGKFEYVLNCHHVESYELTFFDEYMNGGWRPIKFFTDTSLVAFKLFPIGIYHMNTIEGGELNNEFGKYLAIQETMLQNTKRQKQLESLRNSDKFLTKKLMELQEQSEKTDDKSVADSLRNIIGEMYNSGEAFTPEANEWRKEGEELHLKFNNWEKEYIKDNISIASYSLLIRKTERVIDYSKEDVPEYLNLYNTIYAKKYPTHPYSERMSNLIMSYSAVKVGGSFIDFAAPDFKGNSVRLSEQIKGKVALIELWASWCGPCRRSAKSMIPVYEEYKNKGFTVVGVARERELSSGINAATKDGYPWLNLIELKDAGKIWEKYGLGNSGGSSFLVDKDGNILAIHPTAEEVKAKLDELLK